MKCGPTHENYQASHSKKCNVVKLLQLSELVASMEYYYMIS